MHVNACLCVCMNACIMQVCIHIYIINYDKFILAGDFNAEVSESKMANYLGTFLLASLIQENTCFKSLANPSCIDLSNH